MANSLGQLNPMDTDEKIEETKTQINQVITVLNDNIHKVLDRGSRLDELNTRTETLLSKSTTFLDSSKKVKKKLWWKNVKITTILGILGITIVAIIVWYIVH